MTYEEATPHIRKICCAWVRRFPRRFEVDELFNEVWLGLKGDCSEFGEQYALLGIVARRQIIKYVRQKDGISGTVRNAGNRRTGGIGPHESELIAQFDGFKAIDGQDEWDYVMRFVCPSDQPIFKMYYREGLTMREIAGKVGGSVARISMRFKRIRGRLRKRLENTQVVAV